MGYREFPKCAECGCHHEPAGVCPNVSGLTQTIVSRGAARHVTCKCPDQKHHMVPPGESDPILSKADREALALGREMMAALQRGRRLHPWGGVRDQVYDTHVEAGELQDACIQQGVGLGPADRTLIYAEAVDCWVCARRLLEDR